MTPTYTKNRQGNGNGSRFIYYYRCTRTYKHDWGSCGIKSVNADKIEGFMINRLKKVSQDEEAINSLVRKVNQEEEERLFPLKQQEGQLSKEIQEVERKIKNLVAVLAEGEVKRFPSIKKALEDLENKKKVLEFDLEGVRLSIQKEGQVKFEAKIVLDSLKDFSGRLEEAAPPDKPQLFQRLIKDVLYSKEDIQVNIFCLPQSSSAEFEKSFRLAPPSKSQRTIPIILPNTIHQCKKLNLRK